MKGFVFSHPGLLDVCAEEVSTLGITVIRQDEICLEVDATPEKIVQLLYSCQSATKIILGGVSGTSAADADVLRLVQEFDMAPWIKGKKTFRVQGPMELAGVIGEAIKKKTQLSVNLTTPDITFFVQKHGEKGYLGVDVLSFDISKRVYKIFHAARTIKGTLAACLVQWSGYCAKKPILDPCGGSGIIAIEAALFAEKRSPHFFRKEVFSLSQYDPFHTVKEEKIYADVDNKITLRVPPIYCFDSLLPYVKAAQKNAKIAGVDKHIITSKYDIQWLDIKIPEGEIGYIVTQPPFFHEKKKEEQFYEEFFQQSKYVLMKEGIVVLLCPRPISLPSSFSCVDMRQVFSGQQVWHAYKLQKFK